MSQNDYSAMIEKIRSHLAQDGVVIIATYTKAWQYGKKHVDMFKVGRDGSPLVQRGKHWDDIRYCAIRFYTYTK